MGKFNGNGIDLAEKSIYQIAVIRLYRGGGFDIPFKKRHTKFVNLNGTHVCKNAYNAFCTERKRRSDQRVVPRINIKFIAAQPCGSAHGGNIAVSLFYRDHIRDTAEFLICFGQDIQTRARRDIVNDHRERDTLGDIRIMSDKSALRRFVVIRSYEQKSIVDTFGSFEDFELANRNLYADYLASLADGQKEGQVSKVEETTS